MKMANSRSIIGELLAYDEWPPDEDYSPFNHGARLSSELMPGDAAQLVADCWKSLPGTLAASFLDGFLDTANVESLDIVLLDSISTAQEVGSVGSIVRMLRTKCRLDDKKIAERILDTLIKTSAGAEQDRLAYAVWLVHQGSLVDSSVILDIMGNLVLTEYARSCLRDCLNVR